MTFPYAPRQASKHPSSRLRAAIKGLVGHGGYVHVRDTIRQALTRNVAHGARWLIYVAITLAIIEITGWLLRQFGAPATLVGRWVSWIEIGLAIAGALGFLVEVIFDLAESVARRSKKIARVWHGDEDRLRGGHRSRHRQTSSQRNTSALRARRLIWRSHRK